MNTSEHQYSLKSRIYTTFFILLGISVILSFRLGDFFKGDFREFYFSYVANLTVPFGIYFILCILEIPLAFLRSWYTKAILVFLVMGFTEFLQAMGVPILGLTYDPIDLYMIALGAIVAASVDVILFERWLPYWKYFRNVK